MPETAHNKHYRGGYGIDGHVGCEGKADVWGCHLPVAEAQKQELAVLLSVFLHEQRGGEHEDEEGKEADGDAYAGDNAGGKVYKRTGMSAVESAGTGL